MGPGFQVHPGSRIPNFQQDVGTGLQADPFPTSKGLIQKDVGRFNRYLSTPFHGIPGIDHQIHQDLSHLIRIHLNPGKARFQEGFQFDIFPDQTLEHFLQIGYHQVQVRNGLQHLFSAEGQQLLGQGGGPLPGLFDLFHLADERMVTV